MRLPGITNIWYCQCSSLQSDIALRTMAGMPVAVVNTLTPVPFYGEPECTNESSFEHNGYQEKATLSFKTNLQIPKGERLAFIVKGADGTSYVIGTREEAPTISVTDNLGTPSNDPAVKEVEVKFTSSYAMVACTL